MLTCGGASTRKLLARLDEAVMRKIILVTAPTSFGGRYRTGDQKDGIRPHQFMVRWMFKNTLLKNAYTVDEMRAMVAQTPFGKCEIDIDSISLQVLLRK